MHVSVSVSVSVRECVGIQTAVLLATLWISYGHPARNNAVI